jgi:hypothetical protein
MALIENFQLVKCFYRLTLMEFLSLIRFSSFSMVFLGPSLGFIEACWRHSEYKELNCTELVEND